MHAKINNGQIVEIIGDSIATSEDLPIVGDPPAVNKPLHYFRENPPDAWFILSDRVERTFTVFTRNLEVERFQRIGRLKDNREAAISGGVEVETSGGTYVFDSDKQAKDNVSQAAQDAERRPANWPKGWRTFHNEWALLTAEDIEKVRSAIADHVEACFTRHAELEVALSTAETLTELLTINLNDWPSGFS